MLVEQPPVPSGQVGLQALQAILQQKNILAALSVFHREMGDVFRLGLPGFRPKRDIIGKAGTSRCKHDLQLTEFIVTYFGFLALFLLIPLAVLGGLTWRDYRRGMTLPYELQNYPAWIVLVAHVVVAIIYTTPWDNYLVATAVWWYDPALVTGVTIGWVPIEEYTFFILQTFLAGLWLLYLARRLKFDTRPIQHAQQIRLISTLSLGLIWLISAGLLVSGWSPGTYLALILVWALPPIMLQTGFGADILWRHQWLILAALLPPLIYLSIADALAITAGTWTISPAQSLNIYLAGYLPLEEFIFFLITNTLVAFGVILVLARESQSRVPAGLRKLLAVPPNQAEFGR